MLLGFQKKNVLDSDSSDEDNSDDENELQIISKMKSTNSFVKLFTLGRIKKDLQRYFFR